MEESNKNKIIDCRGEELKSTSKKFTKEIKQIYLKNINKYLDKYVNLIVIIGTLIPLLVSVPVFNEWVKYYYKGWFRYYQLNYTFYKLDYNKILLGLVVIVFALVSAAIILYSFRKPKLRYIFLILFSSFVAIYISNNYIFSLSNKDMNVVLVKIIMSYFSELIYFYFVSYLGGLLLIYLFSSKKVLINLCLLIVAIIYSYWSSLGYCRALGYYNAYSNKYFEIVTLSSEENNTSSDENYVVLWENDNELFLAKFETTQINDSHSTLKINVSDITEIYNHNITKKRMIYKGSEITNTPESVSFTCSVNIEMSSGPYSTYLIKYKGNDYVILEYLINGMRKENGIFHIAKYHFDTLAGKDYFIYNNLGIRTISDLNLEMRIISLKTNDGYAEVIQSSNFEKLKN